MDTKAVTSLSLVRHLKASPERVFEAWTDPAVMAKWFFPAEGFTVPRVETDVKKGGRYLILMVSPDGTEHEIAGVYREIVANRRLVFTWSWKTDPKIESVVTIELRPSDGFTELTLTHEKLPDPHSRDMHLQGWTGCLANLERLAA